MLFRNLLKQGRISIYHRLQHGPAAVGRCRGAELGKLYSVVCATLVQPEAQDHRYARACSQDVRSQRKRGGLAEERRVETGTRAVGTIRQHCHYLTALEQFVSTQEAVGPTER